MVATHCIPSGHDPRAHVNAQAAGLNVATHVGTALPDDGEGHGVASPHVGPHTDPMMVPPRVTGRQLYPRGHSSSLPEWQGGYALGGSPVVSVDPPPVEPVEPAPEVEVEPVLSSPSSAAVVPALVSSAVVADVDDVSRSATVVLDPWSLSLAPVPPAGNDGNGVAHAVTSAPPSTQIPRA